jgi:glycerol-3-phosphate dehydrogenase (NAD(P)+)
MAAGPAHAAVQPISGFAMKVTVLGAGAWGTALAIHLTGRHEVVLWGRDAEQLAAMNSTRTNRRYLPGFALPEALQMSHELSSSLRHAELVIAAVPTGALRALLERLRGCEAPLLWLCKGFEVGTAMLPHQVAAEELSPQSLRGALSGPSFAQEIARGLPAALTLAAADLEFARATALQLHSPRLRIYSSDDLIGVEIAGALKNVMAIAAGICDGLNLGLNARAALITRGLAELTRLGLRLGGRAETFMGLAGVGDLILTCTGELSRNRAVGLKLAQGQPLDNVLQGLGHVAEGVPAAPEVMRLGAAHGIEMPITHSVCRVLNGEIAPQAAVLELLSRDPKSEHR